MAKKYKPRGDSSAKGKPRRKTQKADSKKTIFTDKVRLNKYIAESGIASRRKADEIIAKGFVKVNGKTVRELGTAVRRGDFVTLDGDPINPENKKIYILLNKPKDVITTRRDEKGRKTVFDIVRKQSRLIYAGRLDRNTTGALLLTNDGELAHRLTHPSYKIERTYNATLDKPLDEVRAEKIAEGVELEDGMTSPCRLFIMPGDERKITITLTEGKNREVRRIFEHFGYKVSKLDRKMFASLTTKGLNRGRYRHLTREEILSLKKLTGLY